MTVAAIRASFAERRARVARNLPAVRAIDAAERRALAALHVAPPLALRPNAVQGRLFAAVGK